MTIAYYPAQRLASATPAAVPLPYVHALIPADVTPSGTVSEVRGLLLYLPYQSIPETIWNSPHRLVGIALDCPLLWHLYRLRVQDLDAVLCPPTWVERFRQVGMPFAIPAYLAGPESVPPLVPPERSRPIDVLVTGNFNPAIHPDRLILFLNNDVVLTPGWLEGLWGVLRASWPQTGAVGPVSNYAPDAQQVAAGYQHLEELTAFAVRHRAANAGRMLEVRRVTGFCLLTRREVLDRIGTFDERFGIGFFDDDDLCLRIRAAGWKLFVAADTYVHHFGSQTFRALGIDTRQQLLTNLTVFKDKWGAEAIDGYRLVSLDPATTTSSTEESSVAESPADSDQPDPTVPATLARPRHALSMIVRNEERNLGECLRTAADLFDEVVIADTGSTDQTRAIAASFGAKVVEFPWRDSFAAARNASLAAVTAPWVMWLDADDRLDEPNRQRLRALLDQLGDQPDAFAVRVRSAMDPARTVFRLLDQVRIFPNRPGVQWEYRVHEQILPAVRRAGVGCAGRILSLITRVIRMPHCVSTNSSVTYVCWNRMPKTTRKTHSRCSTWGGPSWTWGDRRRPTNTSKRVSSARHPTHRSSASSTTSSVMPAACLASRTKSGSGSKRGLRYSLTTASCFFTGL